MFKQTPQVPRPNLGRIRYPPLDRDNGVKGARYCGRLGSLSVCGSYLICHVDRQASSVRFVVDRTGGESI